MTHVSRRRCSRTTIQHVENTRSHHAPRKNTRIDRRSTRLKIFTRPRHGGGGRKKKTLATPTRARPLIKNAPRDELEGGSGAAQGERGGGGNVGYARWGFNARVTPKSTVQRTADTCCPTPWPFVLAGQARVALVDTHTHTHTRGFLTRSWIQGFACRSAAVEGAGDGDVRVARCSGLD